VVVVVDDGWVKGTRDWTEGGNEKLWCRLKSSVNPRKAPGFCGVGPKKKKKTSVNPKERNSGEIFVAFFKLLHAFPHYLWATPNSHGHKTLRIGEIHSFHNFSKLRSCYYRSASPNFSWVKNLWYKIKIAHNTKDARGFWGLGFKKIPSQPPKQTRVRKLLTPLSLTTTYGNPKFAWVFFLKNKFKPDKWVLLLNRLQLQIPVMKVWCRKNSGWKSLKKTKRKIQKTLQRAHCLQPTKQIKQATKITNKNS